MLKNKILHKPPYGNCKVLDGDGDLMFRCEPKKLKWYLDRGLAKKIDETTIQLLFEPAGPGHVGDEFYLAEKINKCVCCGNPLNLTKHHVVPHCYRKFFPEELKSHSSHDVLVLCIDCHEEYEAFALDLKNKIAVEYNMPVGGIVNIDQAALRARKAAHALQSYRHLMPPSRVVELEQALKDYFGKDSVNEGDIKAAGELQPLDRSTYVHHGEYVVSKIDDFDAFVKRWRRHFVETMNPSHMPPGWDLERNVWSSRCRLSS